MERGSSAAKRMLVFSQGKRTQGGTYGAVKQETPLPNGLLRSVYWAHTTLCLKRLSFVTFRYLSYNMSPQAGLEDAVAVWATH